MKDYQDTATHIFREFLCNSEVHPETCRVSTLPCRAIPSTFHIPSSYFVGSLVSLPGRKSFRLDLQMENSNRV